MGQGLTYPAHYTPTPDVNDCKGCGRDSCEGNCARPIKTLEIPNVGTVHIVSNESNAPNIPRGHVWTQSELTTLKAITIDKEEARIVAEAKMVFDGKLESAVRGNAANPTT